MHPRRAFRIVCLLAAAIFIIAGPAGAQQEAPPGFDAPPDMPADMAGPPGTAGVPEMSGAPGMTGPPGAAEGDDLEVQTDANGDYYIIQKGDTLWDLSRKFLNSPYKWPSMWTFNADVPITNPHWIYPGQKIRLYPRAEAPPPMEEAPPEELPTEMVPPSEPGAFDEQGLAGRDADHYLYTAINRVGFIRRSPLEPFGTIFKVQGRKQMISLGDIVYIRKQETVPLTLGKSYTIYRTLKPRAVDGEEADRWTQHYLTGTVEVIQNEPDYVVGRVSEAFRPIRVDDKLMPYTERSPKIFFTQSPQGISGRIVAPEETTSIMLGEHSIAFIDQGEESGLAPGQKYAIFHQHRARIDPLSTKTTPLPPVDLGTLLVLRTEPESATVLITRSQKEIPPGAMVRSPPE